MSTKITAHIRRGEKLRKEALAKIGNIPSHKDRPSDLPYDAIDSISEAGSELRAWLEISLEIIGKLKPEKLQQCEEMSGSILGLLDAGAFSVSAFDPKFTYASVSGDLNSIIAILKSIKERKAVMGPTGDHIFIVHGHNMDLLEEVKRSLQAYSTNEFHVLSEEPNEGQTVYEKFLNTSKRCSHAIILMTGDDVCIPKKGGDPENRARQNVIFEYGYFIGMLGKENVCLIYEGGVELPSDLKGIAYTNSKEWESGLWKELDAWNVKSLK